MRSDIDARSSAQLAFALDALRGIVILNGGAVIALLAFFGQAWSKNEAQATVLISSLRTGLEMFVAGALSGIVAQGLAFIAQMFLNEGPRAIGHCSRWLCILFAVFGMFFFGYGSVASLDGFTSR